MRDKRPPAPSSAPRGQKRTLSAPRGAITTAGAPEEARALGRFLAVRPGAEWRDATHGFHAYPARMHPHVARRSLEELAQPGQRILDPFCGSGTTLVEALLRGCRGVGVDIHPVAVRLTRLKCSLWSPDELAELERLGHAIAEQAQSQARQRSRAAPSPRRHLSEDLWFAPHVRFEIANIQSGIAALAWSRGIDALEMALSSILVKVSNFESDSSQRLIKRQLPRGYTSKLFGQRTTELARSLAALAAMAPEGARSPRVSEGDARSLRGVGDASVDLIVTSPPYLGTYDYSSHQMVRVVMLGLDDSLARRIEIGSRTEGQRDPEAARRDWVSDLSRALSAMGRVLRDGATALVLVGTSTVEGRTMRTEALIQRLADAARLELVAMASQERPDFTPRAPGRRESPLPEHLIWLRRRPREAAERRSPRPPRSPRPSESRERSPEQRPPAPPRPRPPRGERRDHPNDRPLTRR